MIKLLTCFCLIATSLFGDVLYWQIAAEPTYQFANALEIDNRNAFKFDVKWLVNFTSAFNDIEKHMFFEWLISSENPNWILVDHLTKDPIELDWININKIFYN